MFGSRSSVTPTKSNNDPPAGTGAPQGDSGRFSLIELRRIHQQLIENKQVTEENKSYETPQRQGPLGLITKFVIFV
jgi:hypothetical protein